MALLRAVWDRPTSRTPPLGTLRLLFLTLVRGPSRPSLAPSLPSSWGLLKLGRLMWGS